jgi:hypothetical protein
MHEPVSFFFSNVETCRVIIYILHNISSFDARAKLSFYLMDNEICVHVLYRYWYNSMHLTGIKK